MRAKRFTGSNGKSRGCDSANGSQNDFHVFSIKQINLVINGSQTVHSGLAKKKYFFAKDIIKH